MKGLIYKYTSPSGKCYIGQTNQENKRRYRFLNINQSYGSPKINNARKKYGPENFVYEILFEINVEDKEELRKILGEKEVIFIKQFNAINNGYNHQEGGLYQVNILSPESRRQAALKVSKSILQYSLEGQFIKQWESTMDIERTLGIDHTLISQNCLNKTAHCREFIFRHKVGDIQMNIEITTPIKMNKTMKLSICQMDLNGIELNRWKSISAAAKDLHMCRHKLKAISETEEIYKCFTYKLIK